MTKETIPEDLYGQISVLGYFAVPHVKRKDQQEASVKLYTALQGGDLCDLPEALLTLGRAFVRDNRGRVIPLSKNWVRRQAFELAWHIEALVEQRVA